MIILVNKKLEMAGWDIISAVSFSQINKHIKDTESTPKTFKFPEGDGDGEAPEISGEWKDWELTLDSNDQTIILNCPIKSGVFKVQGQQFDLKDHWVKVEVTLKYYSEFKTVVKVKDSTATVQKGTQKNLMVQTKTDDAETHPIATIKEDSFNKIQAHHMYHTLCKSKFQHYFNANLEEFHHIFVMAIINQQADNQNFQWLKPTTIAYAVDVNKTEGNTAEEKLEKSVFAIMTMTEERPAPPLMEVSSSLLEGVGKNAAVCAISRDLIVKHWILPGLLGMNIGGETDFDLLADKSGYTNNKSIQWATFLDKNNKPTDVKIDKKNFSILINPETGNIDLCIKKLNWSPESGITIHTDLSQSFTLKGKIFHDSSGKPYTGLAVDTAKDVALTNYSMTVSDEKRKNSIWEDIAVEIAIGVVSGIIGEVAGALVEKFAPVFKKLIRQAWKDGNAILEGEGERLLNTEVNSLKSSNLPTSKTGNLIELDNFNQNFKETKEALFRAEKELEELKTEEDNLSDLMVKDPSNEEKASKWQEKFKAVRNKQEEVNNLKSKVTSAENKVEPLKEAEPMPANLDDAQKELSKTTEELEILKKNQQKVHKEFTKAKEEEDELQAEIFKQQSTSINQTYSEYENAAEFRMGKEKELETLNKKVENKEMRVKSLTEHIVSLKSPTNLAKSFFYKRRRFIIFCVVGAAVGGVARGLYDEAEGPKGVNDYFKAAKLQTFVDQCVESVHWPQNNEFKFSDIELCNGGVKLMGELGKY